MIVPLGQRKVAVAMDNVNIRFAQFGNSLDDADGYANDPIRAQIEKDLNITVEYDTGTDGFDDRMQTELYTGSGPDLFPTWGETDKIAKYIEDGLVTNIGDIINASPDRYPTLYKIINSAEYKAYNKLYTGDENTTYAIYSVAAFAEPSFAGVSVYNQSILDEVNGGKVPATVDEFMKVGEAPEDENTSPEAIRVQLRRSLKRLGTDYVDLYYLHRFDPNTQPGEIARALGQELKAGTIRAWGVSNYTYEQLLPLLAAAREENIPDPAMCQPPLSLVNTGALEKLIPFCAKEGIGVIPYQVLQGGILSGKYRRGMPSLTLAPDGSLLAVWNGGFLQWNGDPMGRDAKDWVSRLAPGEKTWSNPDAVGCDIRYCCHDPIFIKNKKDEIILLFAKFLDTEVNFTTWCNGRDELWMRKTTDCGRTWQPAVPAGIQSGHASNDSVLLPDGTIVFASTSTELPEYYFGAVRVYRSHDDGETWE